jgi:dinuclear metal center YbgI/SA1388 family protein
MSETIKIGDVCNYLEDKFPISSQASFDNCGLLIGSKSEEVKGILTCLDCTEDVLAEAIELDCNLIVAHHPLIFKGLKKITGTNSIENIAIQAIKNNIAIYAIHTNLDHSIEGVNAEIAKRLGIVKPRILQKNPSTLSKLIVFVPTDFVHQVEQALFNAGAGKIGNYAECSFTQKGYGSFMPLENSNPFEGKKMHRTIQEECKLEVLVSNHKIHAILSAMQDVHPYEEIAYDLIPLNNLNQEEGSGMIGELENPIEAETFLALVKNIFHCGIIRHTNLPANPIKRIAFCGGSGSFLIKDAIRQGADIFLTGDIKYHDFFEAENNIIIADIGHYESEQFTINLISVILKKNFTKFAVLETKVNTNPINYF